MPPPYPKITPAGTQTTSKAAPKLNASMKLTEEIKPDDKKTISSDVIIANQSVSVTQPNVTVTKTAIKK